jgi:arginyl-tRNA synthetase
MLAWQQAGGIDTPETRGIKGDHLVGEYYVQFERAYKAEMQVLIAAGATEEAARTEAPLFQAAAELYRRWEASDPEVLAVWRMMNQWVYDGHFETYRRLGISFDKLYYESGTYLLGRQVVEEGLASGVFYRKPDGSVWVDLTDAGLDHKLVLRSDGTSVYITQDLGTAQLKFEDFAIDRSIYVIGNEQDYHMKVLIEILRKMGKPYARGMYHLSYGMVELPHGRMKTREGTVVDADDLIDLMLATARHMTDELGKTDGLVDTDREALYTVLALGALKYYLLRVDPTRKMVFNPEESIDFKGDTGTFVQYTYARTQGILRRAETLTDLPTDFSTYTTLEPEELDVLKRLTVVPEVLAEAVRTYSPSVVAHYLNDLARAYSRFHSEVPVLKAPDPAAIAFRIALTRKVGECLKQGLGLLGIDAPDRM